MVFLLGVVTQTVTFRNIKILIVVYIYKYIGIIQFVSGLSSAI